MPCTAEDISGLDGEDDGDKEVDGGDEKKDGGEYEGEDDEEVVVSISLSSISLMSAK